ncbi:ceramide very long chain fatty acid hydroxylase SCS7 [Podospora australis]|uniref:Ceramide very long chain fatty acid hydroxylase n=1 Tax=Podospora australis TaxID=1536484 RepID=A0AAN6WT87_9PEZI|nr:ceramide very long chain fatty acid hydroxylase SCS7 [Podospora australis]
MDQTPHQSLPTFVSDDILTHKTSKPCHVIRNGRVYDVTDFLSSHPGGSDLILEYGGKDITNIFHNKNSHVHSEAASEVLEAYLLGFTMNSEMKTTWEDSTTTTSTAHQDLWKDTDARTDYEKHKFLDLDKPLLPQMLFGNFTKAFYLDQVHRPRHYKGGASAPLYGNFLEPLSLTPWYVVPLVWLPAVAYGVITARKGLDGGWSEMAGYFGFGLFCWTLIEYMLHRFLFHLEKLLPDNNMALTAHFLLHGIHHYLPMDRLRLVMPPSLFIPLATPVWKLTHLFFSHNWHAGTAVFCGILFGYVCYDMTHYFLHHRKVPFFFQRSKTYHLQHHYMDHENGFGVTSRFWDVVFGSQLSNVGPKRQ